MRERPSATATPPAAAARPAPPLPAATLVLLRDGPGLQGRPGGIEVLLLRRNQATRFAPGAFVFPGGRVDAADSSSAMARAWDDLLPASAAERLGLALDAAPSAIAYYAAAVRETFEETGILPCVRPARSGEPVTSPIRSKSRSGGDSWPGRFRRPALRPRAREASAAREALLDGVVWSPGPGDPRVGPDRAAQARALIGRVPLFGICLGHQVIARALGADTFKLPFGHRGGNHPVRDERTGAVAITAQNHGYAVDPEGLPASAEVSHVNLNDGTVEGLAMRDEPVMAIQYHAEASPGPLDSMGMFDRFTDLMRGERAP